MIEEYLDKYMPMKIQSTINGAMSPILSPKKKKIMNKVMQNKMEKMKNNILSEKEANIEEKLNRIAKASGREKFEYNHK